MRLLKRSLGGDFELISFDDDNTAPYAILSHTWNGAEEVTYNELVLGTGKNKTGYAKINFCMDKAADDGLDYCWVDTCCINKSTSDELSTAINTMFRYYQRASKCYVYLSDVHVPAEVVDAEKFPISWSEAFRQSRWFTRGWTLQELLAPSSVEFFSKEGKRLGSRISLEHDIHHITRIPIDALRGRRLSEYSVAERMSWASKRTTTLKEDKAYCLLGIFQVFLPLLYGEGEDHAALRLQEEISNRKRRLGICKLHDIADSAPLSRSAQSTEGHDHFQRSSPNASGKLASKAATASHQPCFIDLKPAVPSSHHDTEVEMFLESLKFPDMQSRMRAVSRPADGTCFWLFDHLNYQDWFLGRNENQRHGLLFLKGHPGTGKSTIVKEAFRQVAQRRSDSMYACAAHFFSNKASRIAKSLSGMLRHVLLQLSNQCPEHMRLLGQALKSYMPCGPFEYLKNIEDIFNDFMMSLPAATHIYIFIDALDEAAYTTTRKLPGFCRQASTNARARGVRLNFLISTRHYSSTTLDGVPTILMESHNSKDIASYVTQKLVGTIAGREPKWELLRGSILEKSSGVFLWIVLVLERLLADWETGKAIPYLLRQLDIVPGDLELLFRSLFTGLTDDKKFLAKYVFHWALIAMQPLRLHEWHHILAFARPLPSLREWRGSDDFTETDDQLERVLRNVSKGLIVVQNSAEDPKDVSFETMSVHGNAGSLDLELGESRTVQVTHQSVREFFLTSDGQLLLGSSLSVSPLGQAHLTIVTTCLHYLNINELDALAEARAQVRPSARSRSVHESSRFSASSVGAAAENTRSCIEDPASKSMKTAWDHKMSEDFLGIDVNHWINTDQIEISGAVVPELSKSFQSSNRVQSIHGCSAVLEVHPALLSYAIFHLFDHASLARSEGIESERIMEMLMPTWERYVALNEDVPAGTELSKYAIRTGVKKREPGLEGRYIKARKDLAQKTKTSIANSNSEHDPTGPDRRDNRSDRRDNRRSSSVASFSSAGSYGSTDWTLPELGRAVPNQIMLALRGDWLDRD